MKTITTNRLIEFIESGDFLVIDSSDHFISIGEDFEGLPSLQYYDGDEMIEVMSNDELSNSDIVLVESESGLASIRIGDLVLDVLARVRFDSISNLF